MCRAWAPYVGTALADSHQMADFLDHPACCRAVDELDGVADSPKPEPPHHGRLTSVIADGAPHEGHVHGLGPALSLCLWRHGVST